MIIHIFNDKIYFSQKLSTKTTGMYPIYLDGEIVANILVENGKWVVRLSQKFTSNDIPNNQSPLELYKTYYAVTPNGTKRFFIVVTPRYNPAAKRYNLNSNELTIGDHPDCDVYYPLNYGSDDVLKLTFAENGWLASTTSKSFCVSGHHLINNQKILNGDYLFFYGLRITFISHRLIIDSPGDFVKINSGRLTLAEPDIIRPVPKESSLPRTVSPLYSEKDYFYKSPRLNYIIEEADVEIDRPPAPVAMDEIPAILQVGPQITMAGASGLSAVGLVISMTSGSANPAMMGISIGTMLFSSLGMLIWPILTRAYNKRRLKRREKKRQKKYKKYLEQKKNHLNFIVANQKQTLLENHPDPTRLVEIIAKTDRKLWERGVGQSDFLSIRLGLGKVDTKLKIEKPREEFTIDDDDDLLLEMKKIVNDALVIPDAPVTYDLKERAIDAIVGDPTSVKNFLDCFFLQVLALHSYSDLKIIVFTKEPEKWDFFKTTPHCWNNEHTTRYFTTTIEQLNTICSDLEKSFIARVANDEEEKREDDGGEHESKSSYKDFRPYYLFFIDDMTAVRKVPIIDKILRYKRNLGFSILTVSSDISKLPNETTDFIYVSPQGSFVMSGETNSSKNEFTADFNKGLIDINYCTEKLANVPVPIQKGKFELPASISFLELYKSGRVEQLNSFSRWQTSNPANTLSVPIGIDQNGEVFEMDIHEKAYGPHGLIAGTTGSGKSEWIITYILSLAVNFSPDEVQFVIIDYKGGGVAKSFENGELGIKLPHLAGMITNLDKSEIFRSIAAIESELKRRQTIFNITRERLKEGSMDIYKYQQYYRQGLVDQPMSHLLIICDEFAELKSQEPEFMDQLISTSRIGRSLGVHLILATQKPSGVVNDQIWSNSKFKVCLKVQDRSDSSEILKKPDAAYLKQTGAFYLQVGNDDYYNLGQVAWAGAKYYPSDEVEHEIDNSVEYIDEIGRVVATFSGPEQKVERKSEGEQLLNLVSYISNISKQGKFISRPLWLENIADQIFLGDVKKKYQVARPTKYTYRTLIGEYDEPREQTQGPISIDLSEGNIAIMGKADSSIEKLLSSIIWSSVTDHAPTEIAHYIIDFGTETMKKFAKLPHVGEVVFQNEMDRVAGVLNLITDEMDHRKTLLSDYNGSFQYYNKISKQKLPLIVITINNFDVFSEALPRADGIINELFRDAPKYGIIFIVTANMTNAIGYRQQQFFNHIILMQLADDNLYREMTGCRRGLIPKKVVGRGIIKLDPEKNDSYCEFQTAFIAPEEQELEIIKAFANKCVEYYKYKVKQLTKTPDDATSTDMAKYITDLANVPIGYNLYEKDIAKYNFLAQKIHLITGQNLNDNLAFIYGLTSLLSKIPNIKVRLVDMLDIFKKPILDIKLFNSNIDTVFAALENDVLTRTETQDIGVNIILGAGSYKSRLSSGGIEIFQNLFNHLAESKRSIYIMVDSYEQLKNLRLEPWFKLADPGHGIWLGPGLDSQSLFEVETVSDEDKKYSYAGLAYNLSNKKYQVIKTIMDKDN